ESEAREAKLVSDPDFSAVAETSATGFRVKPLILVIEDDAQILRFLRAALVAEEYRLQEAMTAEEGMREAAARQPDLILLDLGLPDQDGLEVIRRVREF